MGLIANTKRLRAVLTASLMLVAIAGSAAAGPLDFFRDVYQKLFGPTQFEKGEAAYIRHDYATALQLWQPLADKGDGGAQTYLGLMYDNGSGVPRNYAEAAKWYRLAAEQNYAVAQGNLGEMYNEGRGVPKDEAEAVKWLCRAADADEEEAQTYLEVKFEGGREVCKAMR